jgi:hypothetical protein
MDVGVRGMRELVDCGCDDDPGIFHFLCSEHSFQCCGHFQCDGGNLEHCSSQQGSSSSRSHIAAECRSRDLRWRLGYVL